MTTHNEFTPQQLTWIEALESGKYAQTTHNLHTKASGEGSFCCLGLYCMLRTDELKLQVLVDRGFVRYSECSGVMPYAAFQDASLNGDMGQFRCEDKISFDGQRCSSLAGMNDSGLSFKKIASFLRQYPAMVFCNFDLLNAPDNLQWIDDKWVEVLVDAGRANGEGDANVTH